MSKETIIAKEMVPQIAKDILYILPFAGQSHRNMSYIRIDPIFKDGNLAGTTYTINDYKHSTLTYTTPTKGFLTSIVFPALASSVFFTKALQFREPPALVYSKAPDEELGHIGFCNQDDLELFYTTMFFTMPTVTPPVELCHISSRAFINAVDVLSSAISDYRGKEEEPISASYPTPRHLFLIAGNTNMTAYAAIPVETLNPDLTNLSSHTLFNYASARHYVHTVGAASALNETTTIRAIFDKERLLPEFLDFQHDPLCVQTFSQPMPLVPKIVDTLLAHRKLVGSLPFERIFTFLQTEYQRLTYAQKHGRIKPEAYLDIEPMKSLLISRIGDKEESLLLSTSPSLCPVGALRIDIRILYRVFLSLQKANTSTISVLTGSQGLSLESETHFGIFLKQ